MFFWEGVSRIFSVWGLRVLLEAVGHLFSGFLVIDQKKIFCECVGYAKISGD